MKNLIIVFVFILQISFVNISAFAQEESAMDNKKEKDPFFTVSAQFSYFPTFIERDSEK